MHNFVGDINALPLYDIDAASLGSKSDFLVNLGNWSANTCDIWFRSYLNRDGVRGFLVVRLAQTLDDNDGHFVGFNVFTAHVFEDKRTVTCSDLEVSVGHRVVFTAAKCTSCRQCLDLINRVLLWQDDFELASWIQRHW